jgi:hypothetical protein
MALSFVREYTLGSGTKKSEPEEWSALMQVRTSARRARRPHGGLRSLPV